MSAERTEAHHPRSGRKRKYFTKEERLAAERLRDQKRRDTNRECQKVVGELRNQNALLEPELKRLQSQFEEAKARQEQLEKEQERDNRKAKLLEEILRETLEELETLREKDLKRSEQFFGTEQEPAK